VEKATVSRQHVAHITPLATYSIHCVASQCASKDMVLAYLEAMLSFYGDM